tara:strand:- start:2473 stop:2619 length:147 start_codon:yes stop_codon:yes gene_type:complete
MEQILNPFEDLNPLSDYLKFKNIIMNIKDKKTLLEISKILEEIINEKK